MKILIVALEPSGDNLGAGLIRALKAQAAGPIDFIGIGGPAMAAEGFVSAFGAEGMAIFGLDALGALLATWNRIEDVTRLAQAARPDAAVLIDSWLFNFLLAHRLRRRAPSVARIKYVAPQVWASRSWRARDLAKAVDHLLAIHSFEPPYFERAGLATTFVGNPVLAAGASKLSRAEACAALGLDPGAPVLLLLPGSRAPEVRRLAPIYEQAVARLMPQWPNLQLVLPLADAVAGPVRAAVAAWRYPVRVVEGAAAGRDAMRAATVALAKSGTVTTELALAGAPMVVTYKVGFLTGKIVRAVIRTPYVSLINIAAGREVAPEYLQEQCTPDLLAAALATRLDDADLRASQVSDQNAALEAMGRTIGDPSARAAEAVLQVIAARRQAP
ncbi:MAG TPA: lipid-A-disaccharide synthase [Caulobacteraceae bacterium]